MISLLFFGLGIFEKRVRALLYKEMPFESSGGPDICSLAISAVWYCKELRESFSVETSYTYFYSCVAEIGCPLRLFAVGRPERKKDLFVLKDADASADA